MISTTRTVQGEPPEAASPCPAGGNHARAEVVELLAVAIFRGILSGRLLTRRVIHRRAEGPIP